MNFPWDMLGDWTCVTFFPLTLLLTYILYKAIDFFFRIPYISNIKSRYVLVTGCDTGFGRHLVTRLDTLGCHVFAGCLTQEGADDISKTCSEKIVPLILDVTDIDSIKKAVSKINGLIPEGQGLWAVINNAGILGKVGPSEWMTKEDRIKVLNVNVLGAADVINAVLPQIKATRGRIINMASSLGRLSVPYSSTYSMSKFAMEGFSDALRKEMMVFGVSVHILEPGAHCTDLMNMALIAPKIRDTWQQLPEPIKQDYGASYVKQLIWVGKFTLSTVGSPKLSRVVSAYEHALFAIFPRGRYLLGWDAYGYVILSFMPEWITDLIFRFLSAVPERGVP